MAQHKKEKNWSIYTFKNTQDLQDALRWMKDRLSDKRMILDKFETEKEGLEENISELDKKLDSLFKRTERDKVDLSCLDFEDIWDRFQSIIEKRYAKQRSDTSVVWREWQNEKKQVFSFGYEKGFLKRSVVVGGGVNKMNEYTAPPPKISWELECIEQKGLRFYMTSAKVNEVEQVCSVPSLPLDISSEEAGRRVLDRTRNQEEWQRRVDPNRIKSIEVFVGQKENIIANAAILFIRDDNAVSIIKERTLEIDFTKFLLMNDKGVFTDHERIGQEDGQEEASSYYDHRPIWLIDGQHRIRGLSRSAIGHMLKIPLIIFPHDFKLSGAAKVFAEINTLQTKLEPLHTLFLRHRFRIPSPFKKMDFSEWESNPFKNMNARANSNSYEIAARLASDERSVLFDQIQILEENRSKYSIFRADTWVTYARSWFLSEPYGNVAEYGLDKFDHIYEEVNNYFTAIKENCNHDGWADGAERWLRQSIKRGLIQKKTHFQVLIEIFPLVNLIAAGYQATKGPLTVQSFMRALAPLKWVDWTDADLFNAFGGGGEKGRTCLRVWVEDALKERLSYSLSKVMSRNIRSKPGQGILSPPAKSSITISSTALWPTKNSAVVLVSIRPINAMHTSKWRITDYRGHDYTPNNNSIGIGGDGASHFILKYESWMDDVHYIEVRVDWNNAVLPTGMGSIRLTNPIGR